MRQTLLRLLLIVSCLFASVSQAQESKLAAFNLPEFLRHYGQSLSPLDDVYSELENENLPLRDEAGQPLGRRPISDHRQTLADLRQTLRQLAASPQDLVLTATLFVQSEALADDLFDLSQIAYDNDREELAKRLGDLLPDLDHDNEEIESYVLGLAAEKQDRIQNLENENRDLQQKLKEALAHAKARPHDRHSANEAPSEANHE